MILSSPMWVLHYLHCENVVIRNVIVESFPGANTDGVEIDSSRHVRISGFVLRYRRRRHSAFKSGM